MEGFPDFAISTVLSSLSIRDSCRCACISKEWASCAQQRMIEMRQEAASARAQMSDDEKRDIDQELLQTAYQGRVEELLILITSGADVNAANFHGASYPLARVMQRRSSGLGVILTIRDFMVGAESRGSTALHLAADQGYLHIIEVLIINGADVNVTNSRGNTPLSSAAEVRHLQIVEVLITNGADVNAANSRGNTALSSTAESGSLQIVEALIRNGAKADFDGGMGLNVAAKRGYLDIVKVLIANGADVNAAKLEGSTSLMLASSRGHTDVVEALIAAGASLNIRNDASQTSLSVAHENCHYRIVYLLEAAGAHY